MDSNNNLLKMYEIKVTGIIFFVKSPVNLLWLHNSPDEREAQTQRERETISSSLSKTTAANAKYMVLL